MDRLSERDQAVLRSIFDPTATIGDVIDDGDNFKEDTAPSPPSPADVESGELCVRGARLAEAGQHAAALALLTRAIEASPRRAATYNDRAQLYRLMQRDDEAMCDLNRALELTSGSRGRTRALALCQRGLLLRRAGQTDNARRAFAEAADLGSGFAKKQVVELNPYAALCNQMLSQVMRGEKDIQL